MVVRIWKCIREKICKISNEICRGFGGSIDPGPEVVHFEATADTSHCGTTGLRMLRDSHAFSILSNQHFRSTMKVY